MKLEELRAKVREWDLRISESFEPTSHYSTILDQLDYHATKEWRVYLPAQHPDFNSNYMERLAAWIGNLPDESDQKTLLEYAQYISFFSHDDFIALYQTALDREVTRWIVSQVNGRLEPDGCAALQRIIHREIHHHTWFCPVTDSMDINEFYKVNHLKGVGHRPGFATLQMLAERAATPDPILVNNIISYMDNPSPHPQHPYPPLKRLVLLEDIVGSGSQSIDAIRWAANNLGKPILFVPLILCPNGAEALRAVESASNGLLKVRPVVELKRSELLGPERHGGRCWSIAPKVEELAVRCALRASISTETFGYNKTGCSIVTFSNTPDNTLPLVHNKPVTGNWEPLFPRIYRD